ncbi:HAD family hydrolase [Haloplanus sp. GCM10025708]|uniref:HAD family hydrolase n=1 Tax=Haloferacaceae TaxID=1644056 RepID=UPI0036149E43
MTYDAVLFDNDGVLVELVELDVLHAAARRAFDAVGVSDPDPDDVAEVAIHVTPDAVASVAGRYDVDPDAFWRARERHASLAQQTELRERRVGLYDDFDAVRSLATPRGIVSSNQQETVDFHHDFLGTHDLFETAYGREPTVESLDLKKPDPHYLERALSDLGAESALFVGDSDADLLAAANAGLDSAFVRRPHRRDHTPAVEPTHELGGLDDLLELDRVPVAE